MGTAAAQPPAPRGIVAPRPTGKPPHQRPVLGIEAHGSLGGSGLPFCRSSMECLSGERTNAMLPSRGGRLMVTPPFHGGNTGSIPVGRANERHRFRIDVPGAAGHFTKTATVSWAF